MIFNRTFCFSAFSTVVIMLMVAVIGCSSSGQPSGSLRIISLAAEHTVVYPLGNTRIDCVAEDQTGSAINYNWSCSDGKIIGSGSQITWEAPRSYGDFHIMAMVDDGKGNSTNKVVTVTVIVRDSSACCR